MSTFPGLSHTMWTPEPQGLGVDIVQLLSHVQLFGTPWTAARRAPCPSPSPRVCWEMVNSQHHLKGELKVMSIALVVQSPQLFGDESLSWGREGKGLGRNRASGDSHAHCLSLSPPQCKPSRGRKRGICWCVDKYGMKLPGMEYVDGDFQCHTFDSSNVE